MTTLSGREAKPWPEARRRDRKHADARQALELRRAARAPARCVVLSRASQSTARSTPKALRDLAAAADEGEAAVELRVRRDDALDLVEVARRVLQRGAVGRADRHRDHAAVFQRRQLALGGREQPGAAAAGGQHRRQHDEPAMRRQRPAQHAACSRASGGSSPASIVRSNQLRFSTWRSSLLHIIGVSVSATNPDTSTAPASVSANSLNRRPVRPGVKASGANTAASVSVIAMTAKLISRTPLSAAWNGLSPLRCGGRCSRARRSRRRRPGRSPAPGPAAPGC